MSDPTSNNTPKTEPEEHSSQDFSREARLQGWVEEDQFRGNPDDWVDAETFVKRGREINPILRASNKRLMERIEEIARQNEELKGTLSEFSKHHENTAKKAYEQALVTLRKEKKEALAAGDTVEALNLADRIDDLKESQAKVEEEFKTPSRPAPTPGLEQDPILTTWAKTNTWFGSNKVLTQLALTYGEELHQEYPDLRGKLFLDELEARLGTEFPDRFTEFGNARRNAAPMTSGRGSPASSIRKRGKGFNDLPADAQAACNKFVKQGLLTQEQYISDYFAGEDNG